MHPPENNLRFLLRDRSASVKISISQSNKPTMKTEQTLWAVKIGDEDWQEQVITSTADAGHLAKARAWAQGNGFDRFRVSILDMSTPPDFAGAVNS